MVFVICLAAFFHLSDAGKGVEIRAQGLNPDGVFLANFISREGLWRLHARGNGYVRGAVKGGLFLTLQFLWKKGLLPERLAAPLAARGLFRTAFFTRDEIEVLLRPHFKMWRIKSFDEGIQYYVEAFKEAVPADESQVSSSPVSDENKENPKSIRLVRISYIGNII